MSAQRGYVVLVYMIVAGALIAGLVAIGVGIDGRGYSRGVAETETKYQARDNEQLRQANDQIQTLQNAARERERKNALDLVAISRRYQGEINASQARHELDMAAVRDGSLRLRDPGAICPAVSSAGGAAEAGPGASGRDGAAGTQLSVEFTAFLVTEAERADSIVRQLSACQAVIVKDRE